MGCSILVRLGIQLLVHLNIFINRISTQIANSGAEKNAISNETLSSLSAGVSAFIKDYNGNRFSESYTFFNINFYLEIEFRQSLIIFS